MSFQLLLDSVQSPPRSDTGLVAVCFTLQAQKTRSSAVRLMSPPVVAGCHSLANRQSCSTPAETQDRKYFSMQLIFVASNVDMINHICQMLSFVENYCQLILLKKNYY